MTESKRVVLITGASSGIGLETSLKLLKNGYTVYGAARRTELMKPIQDAGGHILHLDFYDEKSISQTVERIIRDEGRIDVLINNAGFGLGGDLEDTSIEDAKKQFDVNVFGLARITQLVLPSMREHKSGKIINVSSMAGKFSTPFMGWYHATKYSVEALSDALRLEVEPFGIKISIIEPGFIKTDWGNIAAKNIRKSTQNSPYNKYGCKVASFYEHNYCPEGRISSPSVVADSIYRAVTVKNPKKRYTVGKYSKLFVLTSRIFDDNILDSIKKIAFSSGGKK